MTKEEVISFLSEHKDFMRKKYGVLKIGLFGSYARAENNNDSDIDIAVELDSKNRVDNYFGLLHFLEDNLHKKIDLGIESNLKEPIKKYIEKEIIHV
jgi:predicted nucleotidyltransferase